MKILVVSCSPWRDDNNIGNSYTNIFQGMNNVEIAHICLGIGTPKTELVKKHMQITEINILKNLINKGFECCYEVSGKEDSTLDPIGHKTSLYNFIKKNRFPCFFLIRNLIWCFNNWKCDTLKNFVDDFRPDIIFAQFLNSNYLNDMIIFLNEYTKKPVILYAWDDVYTLKQISFSPIYWINQIWQRSKLREVSRICSKMYVISELQQKEYSKIFKHDCKIIYKGYDFIQYPLTYSINTPLKLIYAGNIGTGRWKTLALIGSALYQLNKNKLRAQLFIYTTTPVSNRMRCALTFFDSVILMEHTSAKEIYQIQENGDILIHVESFDLKNILKVRQSFSTKLVDYFKCGKCIFAAGSKDVFSIKYLIKNNAAIVVCRKNAIFSNLETLINSPELMKKYGEKAWECGRKNHQISRIQNDLMKDFRVLIQDE